MFAIINIENIAKNFQQHFNKFSTLSTYFSTTYCWKLYVTIIYTKAKTSKNYLLYTIQYTQIFATVFVQYYYKPKTVYTTIYSIYFQKTPKTILYIVPPKINAKSKKVYLYP